MSSNFYNANTQDATVNGLDVSQVAMLLSIDLVLNGVLQQLSNIATFNSLGESAEKVMGDSIMQASDMLRAISLAFEKFCPVPEYSIKSNESNYSEIKKNLGQVGIKTYDSIWDNPNCNADSSLRLLGQKMVEVNRLGEGHDSGEVLKNLASFSHYPLQFGAAMASGFKSGNAVVIDNQVVNITGFVALCKRYLSMMLKGENLTKYPASTACYIKTKADFDFENITASAIFATVESRSCAEQWRQDIYFNNLKSLDILIRDVLDKMPKSERAQSLAALFK